MPNHHVTIEHANITFILKSHVSQCSLTQRYVVPEQCPSFAFTATTVSDLTIITIQLMPIQFFEFIIFPVSILRVHRYAHLFSVLVSRHGPRSLQQWEVPGR